jgi:hypothetical protein
LLLSSFAFCAEAHNTYTKRSTKRRGEERSCEIADNTCAIACVVQRREEERRGEERSCEIANNSCAIACVLCAERRGEERRGEERSREIRSDTDTGKR